MPVTEHPSDKEAPHDENEKSISLPQSSSHFVPDEIKQQLLLFLLIILVIKI